MLSMLGPVSIEIRNREENSVPAKNTSGVRHVAIVVLVKQYDCLPQYRTKNLRLPEGEKVELSRH